MRNAGTPTLAPAGVRPAPTFHRAPARARRGVVLIFVVAVLVLLVILSTAFYSTVRSQGLIQANRRTAMQAELAAQCGLTQAARHLRALTNATVMVNNNVLAACPSDSTAGHVSRGDGWVLDAGGRWLRMPDLFQLDATTGARVEVGSQNIFTQEQIDETQPWPPYLPAVGGLDPATFRWSWANFWVDDKDRTLRPFDPESPLISPLVRNMTNTADLVVWPYFPGIALEHVKVPGELELLTASWSRGRRWVLTPNQVLTRDRATYSADLDFFGGDTTKSTYNPNFRYRLRAQQVQQPGYPLELTGAEDPASPPLAFSGYIDYRMVATDLDSRLYLPIGRWVPMLLHGTPNDRLDNARAYGVLNRKTILKELNDRIFSELSGSAWAGNNFPLAVQDNLALSDNVQTWGEMWDQAAAVDPAMDAAALAPGDIPARNTYLFRKYLIPREFNCYPPRFQPDAAHGGEDFGRPPALEIRPALNINTAPREVLAANFAAVLMNEDSAPATLGSLSPEELALRIMRCRPFFSRVDWEDFLAANLDFNAFATVLGAIDSRTIALSDTADSGGPRGAWGGTDVLAIPGNAMLGKRERLLWFRDQIAWSSASRLSLKGFNALLNAGNTFTGYSYYAFTATINYAEDTLNPGNPVTTTVNWTEAGAAQSKSVPQASNWNAGGLMHMQEFNLTDDATLRPAWDTTGTSQYLVPTGGELPDGWGAVDRTEPVIVAMPIKLRSYLFEIISRGRYIQMIDQVPTVRASAKIHAVYDTVHHLYWMRRDLVGEKGALNDP